jgi:hypothetical protein
MFFIEACALVVAVALGAVAIHYVVQRQFDCERLAQQNDVAGFIYSAIGVTYAVVLGFVVVVGWQKYGDVQNHVDAEAAAVFDLYHTTAGFPDPLRTRIRAHLAEYANQVVRKEWPEMQRGALALSAAPELLLVAQEVETFQPSGAGEQDAHQAGMQELLRIFDARRHRILATVPAVPPVLWFALLAGASATLGFTFFFGLRNRIAQLVMTALLAALIAVMFVTIKEFNTPFQGANAIAPASWLYFEHRMNDLPE